MNENYKYHFIKDLDDNVLNTKVNITGIIVAVKSKEKFITFVLDDSTSVVECILFKPSSKNIDFSSGQCCNILAEYEENEYHNEKKRRLRVKRFNILDVNEEIMNNLATLLSKAHDNKKNIKTDGNAIEEEAGNKYYPIVNTQKVKRIPLPRNVLETKLRSLILKCLKSYIHQNIQNIGSKSYTMMYSDILADIEVQKFLKKEEEEAYDEFNSALIDLQYFGFIVAQAHSQIEYTGMKYDIDSKAVLNIDNRILELIKENKTKGINSDDLHIEINLQYDSEIFMISKEYIWEILNDFYTKNQIYQSKPNTFHYFQKAY